MGLIIIVMVGYKILAFKPRLSRVHEYDQSCQIRIGPNSWNTTQWLDIEVAIDTYPHLADELKKYLR